MKKGRDELYPFHFETNWNGLLILRSEGFVTKKIDDTILHPNHYAFVTTTKVL